MKSTRILTMLITAVVVLHLTPAAQAAPVSLSWYSVEGAAFSANTSTMTWSTDGKGCMAPASTGAWRASLNLPDGAIIKALVFGFYNTANSTISSANIFRYNANGNFFNLLSVNSVVGPTIVGIHEASVSTLLNSLVVDNSQNSYLLMWGGSDDHHLCYIRVGYIAPPSFGAALPLVQKAP